MKSFAMLVALFTICSTPAPFDLKLEVSDAPQFPDYERKLDTRVERFDASGRSMVSIVLDLAYAYQLPTGIEYVDHEATFRPINSVYRNESVRGILSGVVGQFPEYSMSLSGGIVDLYSPKARKEPRNLLNRPIRNFAVSEADTHRADFELFCALTAEVLPSTGCTGSLALGQWGSRKITVNMHNAATYEILNAIVAENGNAVWTVIAPPEKLTEIPVGGLWHIYPLESPFREPVLDLLKGLSMEERR